jgi:hypothetical protein
VADSEPKRSSSSFLLLDYIYAGLAAAGVAYLGESRCATTVDHLLVTVGSTLYGTLAQIAAALLGFVITGVSIALVIVQDPKFARFRATRHYSTLWKVFKASMWSLGAATALGIVGIFASVERRYLYFMIFFFVLASARMLHVIRAVFLMTTSLAEITRRIDEENRRLRRDSERAD